MWCVRPAHVELHNKASGACTINGLLQLNARRQCHRVSCSYSVVRPIQKLLVDTGDFFIS